MKYYCCPREKSFLDKSQITNRKEPIQFPLLQALSSDIHLIFLTHEFELIGLQVNLPKFLFLMARILNGIWARHPYTFTVKIMNS